MTNKEKFLALVSKEETNTLERNRERIKNRAMLRESQQIAIKVLIKLDELGWSQKDLAQALEVKPQQITKIVSGKENLTIETQIKLQNVLDIPILASYYENHKNETKERVLTIKKRIESFAVVENQVSNNYRVAKTIKLKSQSFTNQYTYPKVV